MEGKKESKINAKDAKEGAKDAKGLVTLGGRSFCEL
jgi:hypothetical protein